MANRLGVQDLVVLDYEKNSIDCGLSFMNNIIKKLKEKKKKDPAHLSEKQLEKKFKKEADESLKAFEIAEKEEKKILIFVKKELKQFLADKKDLLKLNKAINERFKVEKTKTDAAVYKTASLYFDAIDVCQIPENYYPHRSEDESEYFITPDDQHYWLWNFQINTQDKDKGSGGHNIPDRPGTKKQFVIHGFLFPMTSSVIYLKIKESEDKYWIIYYPNDELFGREWLSTYKEYHFSSYSNALKKFYDVIEKHLDGDEEQYYELKKQA